MIRDIDAPTMRLPPLSRSATTESWPPPAPAERPVKIPPVTEVNRRDPASTPPTESRKGSKIIPYKSQGEGRGAADGAASSFQGPAARRQGLRSSVKLLRERRLARELAAKPQASPMVGKELIMSSTAGRLRREEAS